MPLLLFLLLFGLSLPAFAAPPVISSIVPAAAVVGSSVTLTGGPFDASTSILLGETVVAPELRESHRLRFTVPQLPAGDYLLSVRQDSGTAPQQHTLRLTLPPPVIDTLTPQRLDLCDVQGATLRVSGRNFAGGAKVLVDGAALPSAGGSPTRIDFPLPALGNGLHQVEVVNPDGNRALPHALFVDGTPAILSVSTGADRVVAYDLLIEGRNFSPQMTLLVNGSAVPSLSAGVAEQDFLSPANLPAGGYWYFRDCHQIVYVRRPYSSDPHLLTLQLAVPGGVQSPPYAITTP